MNDIRNGKNFDLEILGRKKGYTAKVNKIFYDNGFTPNLINKIKKFFSGEKEIYNFIYPISQKYKGKDLTEYILNYMNKTETSKKVKLKIDRLLEL